jgi:uncharacterized protein (DUF4213/DUF364 family)
MWEIYDALVAGIPGDITVSELVGSRRRFAVISSEGGVGAAMKMDIQTRPVAAQNDYVNMPLREMAKSIKSWNLLEASLGLGAINAYYNALERAKSLGIEMPLDHHKNEAFHKYRKEVSGKKVAVIGHFLFLEQLLQPVCDLCILERCPAEGDYPDSACEYLLPEQDYVFITGSAMINKTMPRLLELCKNAWTVLVGPSVPLASVLFDFGVDDLSGFVVRDTALLRKLIADNASTRDQFAAGVMVNYRRKG